jgi:hypothetical protein
MGRVGFEVLVLVVLVQIRIVHGGGRVLWGIEKRVENDPGTRGFSGISW